MKIILIAAALALSACSSIEDRPEPSELVFTVTETCTINYNDGVLHEQCDSSLKLESWE